MIVPLDYTWGKMIKNILAAVFFSFITYAIVSDLGKPQHTYSGSSRTALVNQNLP
jgi:hypothetical protein